MSEQKSSFQSKLFESNVSFFKLKCLNRSRTLKPKLFEENFAQMTPLMEALRNIPKNLKKETGGCDLQEKLDLNRPSVDRN